MKKIKNALVILMGVLSLFSFASCSSPSSGGTPTDAYELKMQLKITEPFTFDNTVYLKVLEEKRQSKRYGIYSDSGCNTLLTSPDFEAVYFQSNELNDTSYDFAFYNSTWDKEQIIISLNISDLLFTVDSEFQSCKIETLIINNDTYIEKKFEYKVELSSPTIFSNDDTHKFYITKKITHPKPSVTENQYKCYTDIACTNEAENWTAVETAKEDGIQMTYKNNNDKYFISYYISGDNEGKFSYSTNTKTIFDVSGLKVNSYEFERLVDYVIAIKYDVSDKLKGEEIWYLIDNYRNSEDNDYNYFYAVYTDPECTELKTVPSNYGFVVKANLKKTSMRIDFTNYNSQTLTYYVDIDFSDKKYDAHQIYVASLFVNGEEIEETVVN